MVRRPFLLLAWLACAACQSKPPEVPPAPSAAPSGATQGVSASLPAPETAAQDALPKIPPQLALPANAHLVLKAHGKGVQIYVCTPKKDEPSAFEWKLKGPDAQLFDPSGVQVAKHYAGPTWEAPDGSRVVGGVTRKLDAPDPGAVEWLMLSAREHAGSGVFSAVSNVLRLDTQGGRAPAAGCDAGHASAQVRVPYQANYYFYTLP
jgi:hypothetical protein